MEIMTNEQLTQMLADTEAKLKDMQQRMDNMPAEIAGKFEKALDETFSQAVAETVLRNGHLVAQAIMPHAGAVVRAGLAQTFKGIVLAPVYGIRALFGRKAMTADVPPGDVAAAPAV